MENASKALLIAGAILICILLIAIGMYIYQSALGTFNIAASKMSNQEKQIYNSMINNYLGDNKRGADVKAMIKEVIAQNDQFVGESGKFISIKVAQSGTKKTIPNLKGVASGQKDEDGSDLKTACDKANVYWTTPGENTQDNINTAKKEMRELDKAISSGKSYKITDNDGDESGVKDGIIHTVYIEEL